ncbi:hypothetical protein M501DRAFT_995047 [Patellaria atrata CBS 101060]|uniref:Fucose-specific lectin n=1 Tax=Patellaria atrata CBS 101060 TaxID=1346257 RepID=A0A9P4VLR0_9PEZI|nr:hypothetical protein M501DRAFT_995047 [Patellaria atrata CBS 101060]
MDRETWTSDSTVSPPPPFEQHPAYVNAFENDENSAPEVFQTYNHQTPPEKSNVSPVLASDEPSEVHSPGLESVFGHPADKEVVNNRDLPPPPVEPSTASSSKSRIFGFRRKYFIAVFIIVLIVVIALGVGLGVGLGTRDHSSSPKPTPSSVTPAGPVITGDPDYTIGGSLSAAYYSNEGAFNGSGIALASQSFATDEYGSMVMYYQNYNGQIRWQRLNRGGDWVGGTLSEVVASDAKNGTPISAVAYTMNDTSIWHIFYINEQNLIRQKSNSNATNFWADGELNKLNLTAFDSPSVGLQACWYGNFYGDSDYTHSPVPETGSGSDNSQNEYGMHLWYAVNETSFKQYGWRDGDEDWAFQDDWANKNGHAGVGCYSWGPGTITYTMMVNLENELEVWWKDTNTSLPESDSHPINSWTKSNVVIPNIHPSSSLGYTDFLYAQIEDSYQIRGWNVSWDAENSTIISRQNLTVGNGDEDQAGLPGTHFSVSTLPDNSGGFSLVVFYQKEGSDITEMMRDRDNGQWFETDLPIPDE